VILLGVLSDCEELVGVTHSGNEGNVIRGSEEKEWDTIDKYMDA